MTALIEYSLWRLKCVQLAEDMICGQVRENIHLDSVPDKLHRLLAASSNSYRIFFNLILKF